MAKGRDFRGNFDDREIGPAKRGVFPLPLSGAPKRWVSAVRDARVLLTGRPRIAPIPFSTPSIPSTKATDLLSCETRSICGDPSPTT